MSGAADQTPGPAHDQAQAFAEVLGIVAAARRRVATGGRVDLSQLPDKVDAGCAWVLALPRDEGRLYAEVLLALKRDLDALAEAVRQHRDDLARLTIGPAE